MSPRRHDLAAFWRQRTTRERSFLAVMLVSVAAFAYWFGLLAPLHAWAARSGERHATAQAAQARLPSALDELAGRQRVAVAAPDARFLVQNAATSGLAVAIDPAGQANQTTLRFEAVAPQALFSWLAQLRDTHGLSPSQASVRRTPSGLEGELSFATTPP